MVTTYLVTGGAGFIGSALVRHLVLTRDADVVTVDKLTYAGSLAALASVAGHPRHRFVVADVADGPGVFALLAETQPDVIFHLAAESHVDRSITRPADFIHTNLVGTATLLQAVLSYWESLEAGRAQRFRLVHASTDEVFGSLGPVGAFTEASPYRPSSPYSASKAGADHLVRAWHRTWGLPALLLHASNCYGPFQHPEKLIPTVITRALAGLPIPVYGTGENIRDWLHVDDQVQALVRAAEGGRPGESYLVGARNERRNIDLVREICGVLDHLHPDPAGPYARLAHFVGDRPGHDFRYAVDPSRAERELGWRASVLWSAGLRATVEWYLANATWVGEMLASSADDVTGQPPWDDISN